jgi:hypothetical protein
MTKPAARLARLGKRLPGTARGVIVFTGDEAPPHAEGTLLIQVVEKPFRPLDPDSSSRGTAEGHAIGRGTVEGVGEAVLSDSPPQAGGLADGEAPQGALHGPAAPSALGSKEQDVATVPSLAEVPPAPNQWDAMAAAPGWWNTSEYAWDEKLAHIYRAYRSDADKFKPWAPYPSGAMVTCWPPQGEKAWKDARRARDAFYQWIADQKGIDAQGELDKVWQKMEKQRDDYLNTDAGKRAWQKHNVEALYGVPREGVSIRRGHA